VAESWDDKAEYLEGSRPLYHNADYWRFLIREVWRVGDAPVRMIDFGCGYGWAGFFLLPLLPAGSSYFGFDISEPLLREGRPKFARTGLDAVLARGDAAAAPAADGAFDIAFAHAVLMHLPNRTKALAEMIRVTRPGGLVVTCDSSHNGVNALLHVHETDEQEATPLGLWQRMEAHARRTRGGDGNLGYKTPVLMRQAGLVDIGARVSDAVTLSFPPVDTPEKERVLTALLSDGFGGYPSDEASLRRAVASFVEYGADAAEAEAELRRQMANDYRRTARDYHIVQPAVMAISYGRVPPRSA
jgi:SAM-dependent methyltransferase